LTPGAAFPAEVMKLLVAQGADRIDHPGGTLLDHLVRVCTVLEQWGARRALQWAGLCHAFYGTDGFHIALLDLSQRDELRRVIGDEVEQLVYFYASCDRGYTYPHLAAATPNTFRDRYTGAIRTPSRQSLRDFMELTFANELDIARHNPHFVTTHGSGLLTFFSRTRGLVSEAAWSDCLRVLGRASHD
jgi:hypothetical protein